MMNFYRTLYALACIFLCGAFQSVFAANSIVTPVSLEQSFGPIDTPFVDILTQGRTECSYQELSMGYTFSGGKWEMQCISIAKLREELNISSYPAACPQDQIANGVTGDNKFFVCIKLTPVPCRLTPGEITELNTLTEVNRTAQQWCDTIFLSLNKKSLNTLPSGVKKLKSLKTLSLVGNNFVDLDTSIGNLTQLESLSLQGNPQLRKIPKSIGNLQKLKELRIGGGFYDYFGLDCRASSKLSSSAPVILPDEIGSLAELTTLQINCTTIKSLPESITQLPKLQSLNLNYNQLEKLPEHFGDLGSSLTGALSMVSNNIGLLPEGFGQLVNIRDLDLSNNSLTGGLSSDFGNMTNLRTIKITETQLDRLPDSFGNLANLRTIKITETQLDRLPDSFGNLANLRKGEFYANKLKTLPASFKNLSSLTYLNIAQNPLNEGLPDNFGNLPNLTTLGLENTDLTSLPPSFGNLPLTGTLMCQYCTKTGMSYATNKPYDETPMLNLRNNKLTSLPSIVGMNNFEYINLSENNVQSFSGDIGDMTNLLIINLDKNNLTDIPLNLEKTKASTVTLRDNILGSGVTIRDVFGGGHFSGLTGLALEGNQISDLPTSFGDLPELRTLSIGNNKLKKIPTSLLNLQKIKILHLTSGDSGNPLEELPNNFGSGNLTTLEQLLIRAPFNGSGGLGEGFGHLTSLNTLSIYGESLTHLPDSIGNLQNLTDFSISTRGSKLGNIEGSYGSISKQRNLQTGVTTSGEGVRIEGGGLNGGKIKITVGLYECDLTRAEIDELNSAIEGVHTDSEWCEMQELDLSGRGLSSIPSGIIRLKNLTSLNLSHNNLQHITTYFIGPKLGYLSLADNQLTNTSLPYILTNKLETLDVSNNHLTSFDFDAYDVTLKPDWWDGSYPDTLALKSIRLDSNDLSELPYRKRGYWGVDPLTTLEELSLSGNNIAIFKPYGSTHGAFTSGYSPYYPVLKTLDLTANNISQFDKNAGTYLDKLTSLRLGENDVIGGLAQNYQSDIAQKQQTRKMTADERTIVIESKGDSSPISITSTENYDNECGLTGEDILSLQTQLRLGEKSGDQWCNLEGLDLYARGLNTLPAAVGKLKNLQWMDLASNNLTNDGIPASFSGLTGLKRLSLRNNYLTGTLFESVGYLSNLEELYLDNEDARLDGGYANFDEDTKITKNQINELPLLFGNLTKLQILQLHDNQLLSLPPSFGNLQGFTKITLKNNLLETLPDSFISPNLRELDLSNNSIASLPPSFGSGSDRIGNGFYKLQRLNLRNNRLTGSGLSPNFGHLINLYELKLDSDSDSENQNQLKFLPDTFGQLSALRILTLGGNILERLPDNFGDLHLIQNLDLSNQRLKVLPERFGNMPELRTLNLDNNSLSRLPGSFTGLTGIQSISIQHNDLTDIGDFVSRYYNRVDIKLNDNELTTLPESIGNSGGISIRSLTLHNNKLTKLPDSIYKLGITELNLDGNGALEKLPETLSGMTALQKLSARETIIRELPAGIGKLRNLKFIDMNNAELTELPQTFENLINLEYLNLFGNRLEKLPDNIGSLNKLSSLEIAGNQLETLPASFVGITGITTINLESNQIKELPSSIGLMNWIIDMNLSSNPTLTTFPESVAQMTGLSNLDISKTGIATLSSNFDQLNNKLVKLNMSKTSLGNLNRSFENSMSQSAQQENITSDGKKVKVISQGDGTRIKIQTE